MSPYLESRLSLIARCTGSGYGRVELLKDAHVTKRQAKRIALAKVTNGTIKSAELEKENGTLIWSFDIAQPGTKDVTEVWVDTKTGKITSVEVETPVRQKKEAAEDKVKKWLSK
jgi:Peptidase propeptide and YPEB domain